MHDAGEGLLIADVAIGLLIHNKELVAHNDSCDHEAFALSARALALLRVWARLLFTLEQTFNI